MRAVRQSILLSIFILFSAADAWAEDAPEVGPVSLDDSTYRVSSIQAPALPHLSGGSGDVQAGRIFAWPEAGPAFDFDGAVAVTSGIRTRWSIANLGSAPRGWAYAVDFPTTEISHQPNVAEVSMVTDASTLEYEEDDFAGPGFEGDYFFLRNLETGFYAAIRFDSIYGPSLFEAEADVTWYLQENGTADFSSFINFDDFESGDLSYWSLVSE